MHVAAALAKAFTIRPDAKGRIILEPCMEIPAREKWHFDNKIALSAEQSAAIRPRLGPRARQLRPVCQR